MIGDLETFGFLSGVGRPLPVRVALGSPRVHSPCVASFAAHSVDSSKIAASSIPRVVQLERSREGWEPMNSQERQSVHVLESGERNLRLVRSRNRGARVGLFVVMGRSSVGFRFGSRGRRDLRSREPRAICFWSEARVSGSCV
jgi:hypothetical protein